MIKKLLLSVFIAFLSLYFSGCNNYYSALSSYLFSNPEHVRLLTVEELKQYDGVSKPELYLSILGKVYNVTKGGKHYGPNESYHVFVGRDSSRSFVTGQFSESASSDDVANFNNVELRSLHHWVKFYQKEYPFVGLLIGRYYDKDGRTTEYKNLLKKKIKNAEQEDEKDRLEKLKFPPCNVEWDSKTGSRVWCTKQSGGISRNWVGVPRQLFEPGSDSYRCACINEENKHLGNIKEYEGCESHSSSCFVIT